MPKVVDHEKYKAELLVKCFDLFADKGYGTLTMRELASELGVSTGTLYHYWSGKQEIFQDLITLQTERDRSRFVTRAGKPDTLEKRIEQLFRFAQENEEYFLKQLFISIDYYRQQESREEILRNPVIKNSNEELRKILETFLGSRDREVITFVLNVLSGLFLGRMFEGNEVSFKKQAKILAKMLRLYQMES